MISNIIPTRTIIPVKKNTPTNLRVLIISLNNENIILIANLPSCNINLPNLTKKHSPSPSRLYTKIISYQSNFYKEITNR